MKFYVSLNTNDCCVITRLDCEHPEHHKTTVKRSDFINFWYKKVRVERMINWFQFMAEDSFCAEWIDIVDAGLKFRECIFILDDSMCTSGIVNYLKREIAEYFEENRVALQDRYDNLKNCLSYVDRNEWQLIEAIRKFDETGALKYIEDVVSLDEFYTILKLFKKKWNRAHKLFSSQNLATSTNKRLLLITFAFGALALFVSFFSNWNFVRIACTFVAPSLFVDWMRKVSIKSANRMVLENLEKAVEECISEDKHSNEKKEEIDSPKENILLEFIKKSVYYMNSLSNVDFSQERGQLSALCDDFPSAVLSHDFYTRERFIVRLLEIEEEIYSKVDKNDLSNHTSALLDADNLIVRMEFLGFSREDIERNSTFKMIANTLELIAQTPFCGCESEALKLYRIGIEALIIKRFEDASFEADEKAKIEIYRILKRMESVETYSVLQTLKEALRAHSQSQFDEAGDISQGVEASGKRIALIPNKEKNCTEKK